MATKREPIPLLGPTQEARSSKVNAQRSVNMFPSIEKSGAKNEIVMYPTPGLSLTNTPGSGYTRSNSVKWNGSLYQVIGAQVVKINSSGIGTVIGTLLTSTGRCWLTRGRSFVMIVDGTDGYYTDGNTVSRITDVDFTGLNPTHCAWLDGYFIANGADEEYGISALDNPASWAAADRGSAEGAPDDVLALTATNKDLYLIGDDTTEVHYNSGNATFPFEAYPGGIIDVGIEAVYSLARTPFGLIWLGTTDNGDAAIVRVRGLQVDIISDDDLNYQINQLSSTRDAFSMAWRRHGRTFYAITFPTDDRTWVVDLTTMLPHELKSDGIGRWRVAGIGRIGNLFVCGDYNNGNLYTMSDSVYTENGSTIERMRVSQTVHSNNREITFNRVVLDVEAGVGLTSGQGSDPQVMLTYSDDGGKTWSSEMSRSIGAIGKYKKRVTWDNLGTSYGRQFKFRLTDPVRFVMLGAYADIEVASD